MKKSVFALALFAVAAMCAVAFAGSVPDVLHLAHIEMPQSSDYISLAMTTLAVNLPRAYEQGDRNDLPMIAADIIYEGAAVGVVAGTGYAQPIATTNVFAGFAEAKQVGAPFIECGVNAVAGVAEAHETIKPTDAKPESDDTQPMPEPFNPSPPGVNSDSTASEVPAKYSQ